MNATSTLKNLILTKTLVSRLAVLSILVSLALCVPLHSLRAQSSTQHLSISPTTAEFSTEQGEVVQGALRVVNANDKSLTLYIEAVNFTSKNEFGEPEFISIEEGDRDGSTLAEWVRLKSTTITIEAGKSINVPYLIEVPDAAAAGGHYAALLVGTEPPPGERKGIVRTSQVISSLLFVTVGGEIREAGQIRSFTTDEHIYPIPKATFELRFQNKGTVHLQPQGGITIYNMWGTKRGYIPINQRSNFGKALPGFTRMFTYVWEGESSLYDIGRYTAEVAVRFGSKEMTDSREIHFWVIPVKALSITLLIIVASLLVVRALIRFSIRRMLRSAGIDPERDERMRQHALRQKEEQTLTVHKRSTQRQTNGGQSTTAWVSKVGERLVEHRKKLLVFFSSVLVLFLVGLFYLGVSRTNTFFKVEEIRNTEVLSTDAEEIAFQSLLDEHHINPSASSTSRLTVINTSGVVGIAAKEALRLIENGFTVDAVSWEEGRLSERSVIIYEVSLQDEALKISTLLDGALISSKNSQETDDTTEITVFIGKDRIGKE